MEFCHDGNERANELSMHLIVKLSRQNGNHNRLYGTFVRVACEMRFFPSTSEGHMGFGLPSLKILGHYLCNVRRPNSLRSSSN